MMRLCKCFPHESKYSVFWHFIDCLLQDQSGFCTAKTIRNFFPIVDGHFSMDVCKLTIHPQISCWLADYKLITNVSLNKPKVRQYLV